MSQWKNEFKRRDPKRRNGRVIYDLTNLILPVLLCVTGVFLFGQTFAKEIGYDPAYLDPPLHVFRNQHLFIPRGYMLFNPLPIAATVIARPFDEAINAVLFKSLFPLVLCATGSVLLWLLVSALRGMGLNKNDYTHGTARWGTWKDLKRFGLTQERGIVLAERYDAELSAHVNPANASISLSLARNAPLVCHSGGTNTLMIAPTRSGKGVGSIIPTCLNYPQSMIIFDPKGELFFSTAGFRSKFSHVLKFAPLSFNTIRFNPMDEISLNEQAVADIGLIISQMFEEPKGGDGGGATAFFNNMAMDWLTGLVLHMKTSRLYKKEQQTLSGVLSVLSQAAGEKPETDENGNETGGVADRLLHEMQESKHYDERGRENPKFHQIVSDAAGRALGQHQKVRSDTITTIFSKMQLFQDPLIANVTSASDFKLQDFYDSPEPISLYLVVPFSDVTRIASVFKLLINFILTKFSRGEATYGEVKLKNRIMFLLDEFPVLGAFPFLSKTMGILAGYGINFFIVVQAMNQIVDLYGQNHTFLDNCKTVCVYAPGKVEDAEIFSKMMGNRTVIKETASFSGQRTAALLSNMNANVSEVGEPLMDASELMKLPPTEAIILNQGMPPYNAKKVCYYMDKRFKYNAYSTKKIDGKIVTATGFPPPMTRKELECELAGLPSFLAKQKRRKEVSGAAAQTPAQKAAPPEQRFNPLDYVMSFDENTVDQWAAPYQGEVNDNEPVVPLSNIADAAP